MGFDWRAWGVDVELPRHKPIVIQQQATKPDAPFPNRSQYQSELSASLTRMQQALFVLRECELIEQDKKRQNTARVWINRKELVELCVKRLQWSDDDCTDVLLALIQAKRIELHQSKQGIREVG